MAGFAGWLRPARLQFRKRPISQLPGFDMKIGAPAALFSARAPQLPSERLSVVWRSGGQQGICAHYFSPVGAAFFACRIWRAGFFLVLSGFLAALCWTGFLSGLILQDAEKCRRASPSHLAIVSLPAAGPSAVVAASLVGVRLADQSFISSSMMRNGYFASCYCSCLFSY